MAVLRRLVYGGTLTAVIGAAAGCHVFHDLQWHRLHRMNRGPGMSSDAYYSVQDPLVVETHALEADAQRRELGQAVSDE